VIAFLSICYALGVWLLVFKLRVLRWTVAVKVAVGGIYVLFIVGLLIAINLYQPYSTDLRVYGHVVEIVPRVDGRVVEISVQPNEPVGKGEVLYRIDAREYEYAVARLEARLLQAEADARLAKAELERTREAAKSSAVSRSEVDTWQARSQAADAVIGQTRAELDKARLDLAETSIYAPANGVVPNLPLAVGQVASTIVRAALVPFLYADSTALIASFTQTSTRHIQAGDRAELAFEQYPGRVFEGRVVDLISATGQGQLAPTGTLHQWSQETSPGNFGVRLDLVGAAAELDLTVGAAGAAAIYTSRGRSLEIIRRVVIRIYSWMNYL